MNILIIGGTGNVGRRVAGLLAARGLKPRVLVRSAGRALPPGVAGVAGDLKDERSLHAALRGIERLFLITPHSQTEAEEGVTAVRAAKENGVRRVVYMSAHRLHESPDEIPHLASKKVIHAALAGSGLEHTFIMPNNFYQNDENWFRDGILAGVYAQPFGAVGLSRVDAGDIAEAVVRVLLEDGHDSRSYGLAGPDVLTAEQTAAIWSKVLGRPVRYAGDDLEAWADAARHALPDWLVEDFVKMYAFFQASGVRADAQDLADTRMLLGREPRPFADYAAELGRRWLQAA